MPSQSDIPSFDGDEYPSLPLAYEFVLPSYDWALRRLQAVERRVENLLALITTVTLFFPVIATRITEGVSSWDYVTVPGVIAGALFLSAVGVGIYARQYKGIELIFLDEVYDNHLKKSPDEFKRDFLHYSGQIFRENTQIIKDKSDCADLIAVVFGLEVVCGVVWLLTL